MTGGKMRLALAVTGLLAGFPGCRSTPRFAGVTVGPDEPVTALTLEDAPCRPDAEARPQWLEVTGAELADPSTLLVRVSHSACPGVRFRACAGHRVIATRPGIWEVTLQAEAVDYTRCGGTRSSVLRVDLSSDAVGQRGDLDRVLGAHTATSPTDPERRTPGPVHVDVRLRPDER